MNRWLPFIAPFGLIAGLVAIYALNPYGTGDRDPRARILGFTFYTMPASNMEPTIYESEPLLVSASVYAWREPQPGDVIVLRYPPYPSTPAVMRIIATEGSTVEILDGVAFVDDEPIAENYVHEAHALDEYSLNTQRWTVPADSYFVLGDSRDISVDSRKWGFVPRSYVLGMVIL
jgi:signal peptidase I